MSSTTSIAEPRPVDAAPPRVRPVHAAAWVAALLALNVVWRAIRYGVGFPMWGDEAFVAVNFLTRDFFGLIEPLDHWQIAPLGFLWVQWAVAQVLGTSEYALRFLPFVAGLASVGLFAALAGKVLSGSVVGVVGGPAVGGRATSGAEGAGALPMVEAPDATAAGAGVSAVSRALAMGGPALLAIGIFAASYYPVRHAAEVKPYAFDLLAALVLLLLAWRHHVSPRGVAEWIGFGIVAALAAWFSYPSVFISGGVLAVFGISALRERAMPRVLGVGIAGGLLLVSFAAMYLTFGIEQAEAGESLTTSGHWSFTFPPIGEPWLLPVWFVQVHTGAMFAYPVGGNDFGSAGTFLLIVIGCIALWRRDRRALLILLSPLPLMFIAAAMQKYPYGGSARVAQHLVPMACLLAGTGLWAIFARFFSAKGRADAVRITMIVCIVIIAAGAVRDVIEPHKKIADAVNKRVIASLAEQTQPGDVWLVFASYGGTAWAPDLSAWGGSAARLRYHVLRHAPDGGLRWGVEPATVEVPPGAHLRFIVYEDNRADLPLAQLTPYLDALKERFGEPAVADHPLGERDEAITIYTFHPDG